MEVEDQIRTSDLHLFRNSQSLCGILIFREMSTYSLQVTCNVCEFSGTGHFDQWDKGRVRNWLCEPEIWQFSSFRHFPGTAFPLSSTVIVGGEQLFSSKFTSPLQVVLVRTAPWLLSGVRCREIRSLEGCKCTLWWLNLYFTIGIWHNTKVHLSWQGAGAFLSAIKFEGLCRKRQIQDRCRCFIQCNSPQIGISIKIPDSVRSHIFIGKITK